MSLTSNLDDSAWPVVELQCMAGVDALPQTLTITCGETAVTLQ